MSRSGSLGPLRSATGRPNLSEYRIIRIPFFLAVDVEPNEHLNAGPRGPVSWTGVDATWKMIEEFRRPFEDTTGSPMSVGWYLRMDPQLEAMSGSAETSAGVFGEHLARIDGAGTDYVGLHVHASRWDERTGQWVTERRDRDLWFEHAQVALQAYAARSGEPAVRFRYTRGLTSPRIAALLARSGVRVDLSPEPPHHGYFTRLSREISVPDPDLGTVVIPATSRVPRGGSRVQRVGRRLRRGPYARWYVSPYTRALDPSGYWDEVERSISGMVDPFVAIAFRTQAPGSWHEHRQHELLITLLEHPLRERIELTDPLNCIDRSRHAAHK